jgi:RNA polymerase sigma-70 factor (ECF subfamily)
MVSTEEISELYQKLGPALFRRAQSLLGDPAEAHEIVQETFLQFWSGRSRFRKASSAFTYLYRITTNLSIDRLRRRKTAGFQMDYNDELLHQQAPLDSRIEAASELSEVLTGLDDELVTIAVMSHIDGLTQEEIAEAMGLSRRTIVKRLKKFAAHAKEQQTKLATEGA